MVAVVQWLERWPVEPDVVGSNPTSHPIIYSYFLTHIYTTYIISMMISCQRSAKNQSGFVHYFVILLIIMIVIISAALLNLYNVNQKPLFSQSDVPIIPRSVLFGSYEKWHVRISPDGKYIAYLSPDEDAPNIWVAPTDNLANAKVITHDHHGISRFWWAYNNKNILFLSEEEGKENWFLNSVDIDSKDTKLISPTDGYSAYINKLSPNFPDEVLVELTPTEEVYSDIYKININLGNSELVFKNPKYTQMFFNDSFELKLVREDINNKYNLIDINQDPPVTIESYSVFDMTDFPVYNFSNTGNRAYLKEAKNSDTAALVSLNISTLEKETLASDKTVDLDDMVFDARTNMPQAAAFTGLTREWVVIDDTVADDFGYLKKLNDGDFYVVSKSIDDNKWVVVYSLGNQPDTYYVYDKSVKKATLLFSGNQAISDYKLAKVHPITIKSRDNLILNSYLTLPLWNDINGRTNEPIPVVILVHGGPWSRDRFEYNTEAQWLANRGFGVLMVNFRGSDTFGKNFLSAGNREWGGKMQDDLHDAVDFLINKKIATPDKIVIMGTSYGGYASLYGMTKTPDFFAAGISVDGPSNLVDTTNSMPASWYTEEDFYKKTIGDFSTDEGKAFLSSISPITYVNNLAKPLLMVQGANDPRVRVEEAIQFSEQASKNNVPFVYVEYPNEGHGFEEIDNIMSFYSIAETFLNKFIGGRLEETTDEVIDSEAQIKYGQEYLSLDN